MNTPISAITPSPKNVGILDSFLGVNINGSVKTDYIYSFTQLLAGMRKNITIGTAGTTLTDDFFSNTINEIVSNGVCYVVGQDFTQTGTTITATTFTFTLGEIIIAKL